MNVVSLYFPLLIISNFGVEDIFVGMANSISQIAVMCLAPILGTISDKSGKRMSLFTLFAIGTVLGTIAISLPGEMGALWWKWDLPGKMGFLWLTLAAFVIANVCYQLSLTFYNSLLPRVGPRERWGKISGFGTALGYVGSIIGMALIMPFNTGEFFGIKTFIPAGGRIATFLPTAIIFAIFALPTLIYYWKDELKENYPIDKSNIATFRKIVDTIRDAKNYRGIRTFLFARFLFQEGVETTIVFMAVFAEKAMGMPDSLKIPFFMISTTSAVFGSLIIGRITDRIGAHRTLMGVLIGWIVGLAFLALLPYRWMFWIAGIWLGAMLGGVWTSSRPYLLHLSPPDTVGRFFGLYSLTGKAAAAIGPLIWGGVTILLRPAGDVVAYRGAITAMGILIALGAIVLHKNGKLWGNMTSNDDFRMPESYG